MVIKVAPASSADAIQAHLAANVTGQQQSATDDNLAPATDLTKVKKYYKLNGLPWLDALEESEKRKEMETLVLGAMALRGL